MGMSWQFNNKLLLVMNNEGRKTWKEYHTVNCNCYPLVILQGLRESTMPHSRRCWLLVTNPASRSRYIRSEKGCQTEGLGVCLRIYKLIICVISYPFSFT